MLVLLALVGCAREATAYWSEWDEGPVVSAEEVEDLCAQDAASQYGDGLVVVDGWWGMTARRPHGLLVATQDYGDADLTCWDDGTGCRWDLERGEALDIGPLSVTYYCDEGRPSGSLDLGIRNRRGEAVFSISLLPVVE